MKRIDFFAWRPEFNATARCRGACYAPFLSRHGWRLRFLPPGGNRFFKALHAGHGIVRVPARFAYYIALLFIRFIQVLSARGADVVVVQRELFTFGPPFFEKMLLFVSPRAIYDIDDAVDLRPPHLSGIGYRFHDRRKAAGIAAMCRLTICSTEQLAERFAPFANETAVIPTPVDTERFRPAADRTMKSPPVLGWVGTGGNLFYLKEISAVLARLQAETGCGLTVISEWDFESEGLIVQNRRWSLDREVEQMREMDIGLMPLTDNEYTRAKAGFKILQYWACGLPVVASPVGINATLVEDGVNGYLASTDEEWYEKITLLLEDRNRARLLGEAGRERVVEAFSISACGERLLRVLNAVADR